MESVSNHIVVIRYVNLLIGLLLKNKIYFSMYLIILILMGWGDFLNDMFYLLNPLRSGVKNC